MMTRDQPPLYMCMSGFMPLPYTNTRDKHYKKAVIDTEHAPGTTFVAISRLPRLIIYYGLIVPMPFQRLQSISYDCNF